MFRLSSAALTIVLTAALAQGCDSETSSDRSRRGLESVHVDAGPGIEFDRAPLTAVGGANDTLAGHALHIVRGALLKDSDRLIVANEGSQSLRYFDLEGNFQGSVGGAGEGPGEFRRLRSLHHLGADVTAAWDAGLRRITLFDSAGKVIRSVSVPDRRQTARFAHGVAFPQEIYSVGNEAFAVSYRRIIRRRPRGFSRESIELVILDLDARLVSLGVIAGTEYFTHESGQAMPVPFSYRFWAAGTSRALYVGNGREPHVLEFRHPDGTPRKLKLPIRRRIIDDSDRAVLRARFLERSAQRNRASIAALLDEAFTVDSFPAFTELRATGDGSLWVGLHDVSADSRRWLVVNPEALVARPIALPAEATVLDATTDRVVLLVADELGRQEVRVHSIH